MKRYEPRDGGYLHAMAEHAEGEYVLYADCRSIERQRDDYHSKWLLVTQGHSVELERAKGELAATQAKLAEVRAERNESVGKVMQELDAMTKLAASYRSQYEALLRTVADGFVPPKRN